MEIRLCLVDKTKTFLGYSKILFFLSYVPYSSQSSKYSAFEVLKHQYAQMRPCLLKKYRISVIRAKELEQFYKSVTVSIHADLFHAVQKRSDEWRRCKTDYNHHHLQTLIIQIHLQVSGIRVDLVPPLQFLYLFTFYGCRHCFLSTGCFKHSSLPAETIGRLLSR